MRAAIRFASASSSPFWSLDMYTPFESPKFLLSQTYENLQEFQRICNAVFSGDCGTHITEVDPETGNKTYKIKFTRHIPGRARHIIATAISDLRHTLDQAACDAIHVITEQRPDRVIYFPFATNPNDLAGRLAKNFPHEIHPVFLSFETYPTGPGYPGGDALLSTFAKISGPNKHQVTCRAGGRIADFSAESVWCDGLVLDMAFPPQWNIHDNELVLAIVEPNATLHYDFKVAFYVALHEAGELSGRPALDTLSTIANKVSKIVYTLETTTMKIASTRSA